MWTAPHALKLRASPTLAWLLFFFLLPQWGTIEHVTYCTYLLLYPLRTLGTHGCIRKSWMNYTCRNCFDVLHYRELCECLSSQIVRMHIELFLGHICNSSLGIKRPSSWKQVLTLCFPQLLSVHHAQMLSPSPISPGSLVQSFSKSPTLLFPSAPGIQRCTR